VNWPELKKGLRRRTGLSDSPKPISQLLDRDLSDCLQILLFESDLGEEKSSKKIPPRNPNGRVSLGLSQALWEDKS